MLPPNYSLAKKRKKRGFSAYYWKEISDYCNYFSHEDSSVLEVGCGSGDLLTKSAGSKKTGIDFSEEYIAWAKEKHQPTGQAGKAANIEFLPFAKNDIELRDIYRNARALIFPQVEDLVL